MSIKTFEAILESRIEFVQAPVPSVALFQDFVRELIALKWMVAQSSGQAAETEKEESVPTVTDSSLANLSLALSSPGANTPAAVNKNGGTRANAVWNRVVAMLNRQSLEATRLGGPSGIEFHREAMYVMAVLADETFLHLEWDGRDYWLSHLLEAHAFRTHAAGDIFFRRIDVLLRREDDAAAELAAVYLFALGLGFRGKYRGDGYSAALDGYRRKLFAFVARRRQGLAEQAKSLFPDAYKNIISTGIDRPIPSARNWRFALLGAFLLWLLVAQILWWNLSHNLNAQLARIALLTDSTSYSTVVPTKK